LVYINREYINVVKQVNFAMEIDIFMPYFPNSLQTISDTYFIIFISHIMILTVTFCCCYPPIYNVMKYFRLHIDRNRMPHFVLVCIVALLSMF